MDQKKRSDMDFDYMYDVPCTKVLFDLINGKYKL